MNMYISRVPINLARSQARRLVASSYRVHAAVEASFPPGALRTNGDSRILWRLDPAPQEHALWLYVVSPEKPDFTSVVEQAGWPLTGGSQTKDYAPLLDRIETGQQWAFRLAANPTRHVGTDKGRHERAGIVGKIEGEVTVDQQLGWLERKGEANGFKLLPTSGYPDVPDCVVSQRRQQRFRRGPSIVTLRTCQFDGTLQVTDAFVFKKALVGGIGRAKGFGCGLLTVAPITSPCPVKGQSDQR